MGWEWRCRVQKPWTGPRVSGGGWQACHLEAAHRAPRRPQAGSSPSTRLQPPESEGLDVATWQGRM